MNEGWMDPSEHRELNRTGFDMLQSYGNVTVSVIIYRVFVRPRVFPSVLLRCARPPCDSVGFHGPVFVGASWAHEAQFTRKHVKTNESQVGWKPAHQSGFSSRSDNAHSAFSQLASEGGAAVGGHRRMCGCPVGVRKVVALLSQCIMVGFSVSGAQSRSEPKPDGKR